MDIEDFALAWRWVDPLHAKLPNTALSSIYPLTVQKAEALSSCGMPSTTHFVSREVTDESREDTCRWLSSLSVSSENVLIVWSAELAVQLPWSVFCEFWDDFCYPASDDADVFTESELPILRWHHYEVFEFFVDNIR